MDKTYYAECCILAKVGPIETSFEKFIEIVDKERRRNTIVYRDGDKIDVEQPVHDFNIYEVDSLSQHVLLGVLTFLGNFIPVKPRSAIELPSKSLLETLQ